MPSPCQVRRTFLASVPLLSLLCLSACAGEPDRAEAGGANDPAETRQAPQAPLPQFDPDRHLRTGDVRIGMTGYGLSVFKGSDLERFDVEVTGILRRTEQLGTDIILIRCSGAGLEHTGPIAGMSGSPVYLHCDDGKDRLLGAFAFGWPGSKDPVAGVQPIEQMLLSPGLVAGSSAPDPREQPRDAGATRLDFRDTLKLIKTWDLEAFTGLLADPPSGRRPAASGAAGRLQAMPLPLGASGLPESAARQLEPLLAPMGLGPFLPMALPMASAPEAGGPEPQEDEAAEPHEIRPGDALLVPLVTGDMHLVATGTATEVIGDRIYGFGHPLFGEGEIDLPLATGNVDAVIATRTLSFKIGSPGQTVGTLTADTVAGISGKIGPAPSTIPVSVTLNRGQDRRTYDFDVTRHPMMTPIGLISVMQNVLEFAGSADRYAAIRWNVEITLDDLPSLKFADVASNADPFSGSPLAAIVMPMLTLERNPFGEVKVNRVEVSLDEVSADELPAATLVGVSAPRTRVRAGEVIPLDLRLKPIRDIERWERVRFQLPKDLTPGRYSLELMDSSSAQSFDMSARPFAFEADSLESLVAGLGRVSDYPSTAVYLRLASTAPKRGLAVGRSAMQDLPPSRSALLVASGRSEVTAFEPVIGASQPLPFVLGMSEASLELTIEP